MTQNILVLMIASLTVVACGSEALHSVADYQVSGSPCTEADRKNHLYTNNHAFAAQWESCSRETWADGPETAQCLVKAFPGFTAQCANCIGEYAACTKKNCLWKCTFGSDESCRECSKANCVPAIEACTGVSWDNLPSKS